MEFLPPGGTIGIVGGGQLGRMSALAAARLGYRCHILTDDPVSPAAQVASSITVGDYNDLQALEEFSESCEIISFEFENIDAAGLELLAQHRPVRPSSEILRIAQDRIAEKSFLNRAGIPTAPWREVNNFADLEAAVQALGLPAVLKTTRLGYDGKGQAMLREAADLAPAFDRLEPKPLILEGFINFACELSVIVARNPAGEIAVFDAVQNLHKQHILDLTLAPAPVDPEIAAAAQDYAVKLASALQLEGLLALELFVDRDGRVLANEMAPRPHNSGHWTIDACPVSQFEMHIRAIAGLPLPPARRHSDAVMKNLVGPEDIALWPEIIASPGLIPHHYGKAEARPGRKLGHVTVLFPRGALPGQFGIKDALGKLASD